MKIAFFYEYGKINEIGTGHKYRSMEIGNILKRNGHEITYSEEDIIMTQWDILVVDHIKSKKNMILRAKQAGTKVVLIDGSPDDTELVDASISAFVNNKAQYRGPEYIVIPKSATWDKYRSYTKSKTIFIGVGGFDANNIAEFVLEVLDKMKLNSIVAKSINHTNFKDNFSRVEMFEEENYYNAMHECILAITNGGLTFFQSLHYGMPTIPIAQYEHQKENISYLKHCCLSVEKDKEDLITKIGWLINNEYYRKSLGMLASHCVDGNGANRVCKIIEGLNAS